MDIDGDGILDEIIDTDGDGMDDSADLLAATLVDRDFSRISDTLSGVLARDDSAANGRNDAEQLSAAEPALLQDDAEAADNVPSSMGVISIGGAGALLIDQPGIWFVLSVLVAIRRFHCSR